jgi:hypothetical protein
MDTKTTSPNEQNSRVASVLFNPVAVRKPAAVNPEKHRPFLAVLDGRREDVEAETILAHVVIVPIVPE